MTSLDVHVEPVSAGATTATAVSASPRTERRIGEYAAVTGAWAVAVVAAATFPLDDPQVTRVALFFHLVSMAVGFGAVVMIDVYGLLWLFGHRTLAELVDLDKVAHGVIAGAVGGLLGSGIALQPDLSTPLARFKMLLVLGLMLNGLAAQRMLQRLGKRLPPTTRGASIPWTAFQRGLAAALISQATWWGAIAIGFITNAQRHS
ncbi:MAG TPA: hypothetical protein VG795_15915 [Acidimicrobiia bacterium]|nr:hypothetical protein [Acidimicrobiia bacterium]